MALITPTVTDGFGPEQVAERIPDRDRPFADQQAVSPEPGHGEAGRLDLRTARSVTSSACTSSAGSWRPSRGDEDLGAPETRADS
jgi:hypothetical protein